MDEVNTWVEIGKSAAQLGLGGILMAAGMRYFQNRANKLETKIDTDAIAMAKRNEDERIAMQKRLDDAQQARIATLELQYQTCATDRVEIHKQMNLDRTSFATEMADIRKNYENRIADLNARILDIYKTRQQMQIADKMEKAASAIGTTPPSVDPQGTRG